MHEWIILKQLILIRNRIVTQSFVFQMDDAEGLETWRKLEMVTSGLAQDLCEQLRLILEPSQASRLKVIHFICLTFSIFFQFI